MAKKKVKRKSRPIVIGPGEIDMATGMILLVDDDFSFSEAFGYNLKENLQDAEVLVCSNATGAKQLLKRHKVNVVIADMHMETPEAGYDLLLYIKKKDPHTQVIVLTGYAGIENAVRCMRAGCFDYLSKREDPHKVIKTVQKALQISQAPRDSDILSERLILSEWDELLRTSDPSKKGIALETLCTFLFRTIPGWYRVESRVRSSTEEIDIVIRNESGEEFWRRFGTFVIVECKNWTKKRKPGRKEFDSFYSKIKRRGEKDCRLGFFISLYGVARTFLTEADRIAKENIVIVSFQEDDLWRLICAPDRSEFLKGQIADQILG